MSLLLAGNVGDTDFVKFLNAAKHCIKKDVLLRLQFILGWLIVVTFYVFLTVQGANKAHSRPNRRIKII